ncbi:MAG: ABC transporter ATP-binding protein/permease [Lachnospiraceae bacterium]|nr:ABC transporter ATP-binding protein/permease [Lachnospiraceae bacterium]
MASSLFRRIFNMKFKTRRAMLWHFLKGNKRFFVLSILFSGLVSLLDLINPKIIGFTVDSVIGTEETDLPPVLAEFVDGIGGLPYLQQHIGYIALVVLAVAFFAALCRYLFRLFNSMAAEKLIKRMRDLLYEHIIHLPFSWHNQNQTGDIIQRCTSDVEVVKNFFAEHMTNLLRVVLLIILAIYFMSGIHVGLTVLSAAFIPVIVGYSFLFHNKIGESFRKVDIMEGQLSAVAQENLTGVRVVRAFGREAYEKERFETMNETYMNTWIYLMKLLSAFWASGDLIGGLQVMLVVVVGAYLTINGSITTGQYIAFVSYNAMLTWPVRMLGRVISEMSKAGISIDRISYILNSPVEEDPEVPDNAPLDQDICFEHVSFSYGGDSAEVLQDVSFTVKAGTTVGILGSTGSGKSTLMYLLDRLYNIEPTQGRITIGGVDIAQMDRSYLREHIGMVLQEPYLFSGTVADNIAITQESTKMQEVRAAAKIAALDEAIGKFGKGYETYVGERGVTLSGGQKQRVAIAQMLIRKPEIMIFDDSLSAVDAETDAKIRKALGERTDQATVILIAHRITTLMKADNIIVLDHGRIVESGTHEQLLAQNGFYRKIYDLQSPEEA